MASLVMPLRVVQTICVLAGMDWGRRWVNIQPRTSRQIPSCCPGWDMTDVSLTWAARGVGARGVTSQSQHPVSSKVKSAYAPC